MNENKKIIVAMSGGVDSAVVAVLLKEQDYEIEGVFMRLGIARDDQAEKNAGRIARKLGIKFFVVDVSKEFKKKVIDYFISEYKKGQTPNPCVECNREIKFGILMEKVLKMGADYVATGHYVRLQNVIAGKVRLKQSRSYKSQGLVAELFHFARNDSKNGIAKFRLLKAKDENKDQSYFLYTLNQKKLKRCLFPLGDYTKDEVKKIAKKYNLKIDNEKESQEICFITSKYYGDFLRERLKLKAGDIIDANNNILGKHKGLPLYTIGQRRDIGIGGTGPYFVIGMNRGKNQLVVSDNKNDKNLFSKKLAVKKVNWVSGSIPKSPFKIKVKTRYRMKECLAVIDKINNKYTVKFLKPQRAVMSGQSVVFYKGNEVLGGGIII
ncbi:MAG: tRNA 2-thiouridine(34) synthase MnmA [Patescibacteria group bacterium]|nr:tRNA 2-thiouridine(34) synthase MnmA [Patescibacteria group bacterium]